MVIHVCIGSACHLKGSYEIIKKLETMIERHQLTNHVTVKSSFCLGNCTEAVSAKIGDQPFSLELTTLDSFFNAQIKEVIQR